MVYLNSPHQYPKKIREVVVKSTCFFIDTKLCFFFVLAILLAQWIGCFDFFYFEFVFKIASFNFWRAVNFI